jgi:hypothetical protein
MWIRPGTLSSKEEKTRVKGSAQAVELVAVKPAARFGGDLLVV